MAFDAAERPPILPFLEQHGADLSGIDPDRTGDSWQKLRCCFHDDRTASAGVNVQERKFKCQACEAWGDVFDLIDHLYGTGRHDFTAARAKLSELGLEAGTRSRQAAPDDSWRRAFEPADQSCETCGAQFLEGCCPYGCEA